MSSAVKIGWIAGVAAVTALIFRAGVVPVLHAFETAGWGVLGVVLLRGVAVVGAGLGWFVLFPAGSRPNVFACVCVRFVREGANTLLPMTQVGGDVIGARALTLCGAPALLSAASVIVDVLVQAVTLFLFTLLGLATLAAIGCEAAVGETVALVTAVAIPALLGFYLAQRPVGQRLVKTMMARILGEREWLTFGAIDALFVRLDWIYANRTGVLASVAIHLAVWLFDALEVWVILACMGTPARYPEALVIESLMQAIRAAAFVIPGALGAQEGGLIAVCAIFGVPAQAAIAMSLIKRVPDFVLGAPSLMGWQVLEGRALLARALPVERYQGK
jgi:putative membrane protein